MRAARSQCDDEPTAADNGGGAAAGDAGAAPAGVGTVMMAPELLGGWPGVGVAGTGSTGALDTALDAPRGSGEGRGQPIHGGPAIDEIDELRRTGVRPGAGQSRQPAWFWVSVESRAEVGKNLGQYTEELQMREDVVLG